MPRILISAGEASGEFYGAQLIEALRAAGSSGPVECFGLGGQRMRAAGCDIVVDAHDVAVVGLAEVVKHLPGIYGRFQHLLSEVDRRKPDVGVLIDFPDFNFRLARALYRRGIPVVYFVSPQLWAWRQSRIKLVKKYVSQMLVIFPFEEEFYRRHGVSVEYVGHPLADVAISAPDRTQYAREHGLDAAKQWVALLPGSRKQEIERNLPAMLEAATELGDKFEYILPVASTLQTEWMNRQVGRHPVHLVADARSALALARASVVASGTATVEAALAGNPFVVVYRVSPLTWRLGRRLVSLEQFAMVNLIAGKPIVPELIQQEFTAHNVVHSLRELLPEGEKRSRMMTELAEVRRRLQPAAGAEPAAARAAKAVLRALSAANPA